MSNQKRETALERIERYMNQGRVSKACRGAWLDWYTRYLNDKENWDAFLRLHPDYVPCDLQSTQYGRK